MKRVVQESKKIEDGVHDGVIVRVEERTEPYKYIDLVIMTKETGVVELTAGFPDLLTPDSKLGLLLQKFGVLITVGYEIDIDKALINKPIQFQTITVKGKKGGDYSRIVTESIKPLNIRRTY